MTTWTTTNAESPRGGRLTAGAWGWTARKTPTGLRCALRVRWYQIDVNDAPRGYPRLLMVVETMNFFSPCRGVSKRHNCNITARVAAVSTQRLSCEKPVRTSLVRSQVRTKSPYRRCDQNCTGCDQAAPPWTNAERYEKSPIYRAIKSLVAAGAIHEAAGMVCVATAAK